MNSGVLTWLSHYQHFSTGLATTSRSLDTGYSDWLYNCHILWNATLCSEFHCVSVVVSRLERFDSTIAFLAYYILIRM